MRALTAVVSGAVGLVLLTGVTTAPAAVQESSCESAAAAADRVLVDASQLPDHSDPARVAREVAAERRLVEGLPLLPGPAPRSDHARATIRNLINALRDLEDDLKRVPVQASTESLSNVRSQLSRCAEGGLW